jgi:hypothetical protein
MYVLSSAEERLHVLQEEYKQSFKEGVIAPECVAPTAVTVQPVKPPRGGACQSAGRRKRKTPASWASKMEFSDEDEEEPAGPRHSQRRSPPVSVRQVRVQFPNILTTARQEGLGSGGGENGPGN